MICSQCNAEVEAGSVFCPKCGERMDGEERIGARITADDSPDRQSDQTPADRFREKIAPADAGEDDDREIELWEGGFSPKAMFTWWVGSAVLTVLLIIGMVLSTAIFPPMFALGVLIALVWLWPLFTLMYRRWALRYRLTSQRFIHEHGILTRVTDRIEVIDIDDVSFKQTLFDRMVGVGTLYIESGDRTHPELVLRGIDGVEKVYDLIDNARRDERMRRGVHIAHAGKSGGM